MTSTCTPIVLCAICFSSILSVMAQDWAPLRFSDQTYAYQYSLDASYRYVRVEEQTASSGDSLFHLNSIVRPCDTCGSGDFVLRNQAHFLQKRVRHTPSGIYHFQDTGSFVIQTCAALGESWLFDSLANITASVSSISKETLWDVHDDSVKVIMLSTGESIRLSKHYGLLEFPNMKDGGSYRLQGIQGRKLGVEMPSYRDFYDFDIGDRFQINIRKTEAYSGHVDTVLQYEIINKRVQGNDISYDIEGVGRRVSVYTYICCDTLDVSYFQVNETLTFTDTPDHPLNHIYTRYPMSQASGFGPNPSPVMLIPRFDAFPSLTGGMYLDWQDYYIFMNDSSDIGEAHDWLESNYLNWNLPQTAYIESSFETGIGLLGRDKEWNEFEYSHNYWVSAAKKNGEIWGEFIPNDLSLDSIDDPSVEDCESVEMHFRPDPGSARSGFIGLDFTSSQWRSAQVLSLDGRKILEDRFLADSYALNLPLGLATGIYVVKLELADGCITHRKIQLR